MSELALLVDDVVVSVFPLDKPAITIGRDSDCDIRIDEAAVSGCHARLDVKPSEFLEGQNEVFLEDLGSTNGTLVNDENVERCRLKPGDLIEIGWNKFKLMDDTERSAETTAFIGRV